MIMIPSNFKKMTLLLLAVSMYLGSYAQYSPAQGPPNVSGSNIRELSVTIFTNNITRLLNDSIIPKANADIAANDPPMNIKLALTSVKLRKPGMGQTEYTDRPNERVLKIPYNIDFELKINNFPNRHIFQSIELTVSCQDWFINDGGSLRITLKADKPYLSGPSITEQVLNAFLLNFLTPYVDAKIRNNLPTGLQRIIPIGGALGRCNCLGAYVDSDPGYTFSALQYQHKRPLHQTIETPANTVYVSVKSIKRLRARNYEQGTVLYDSSENINIEFFINQKLQVFSVNQIREDEQVNFPDNLTSVRRPNASGTLILIANITQSNNRRDSRFAVYRASGNFGNGIRKLIVKKVFISRPHRLPNGQMSKPIDIYVDAYEFTVEIKAFVPVNSHP